MSRIGVKEKKFCAYHGIPGNRLFDASGLRPSEYREIMKVEEKWAAFGVTPCKPGGHTSRNRHGTCLICDTARLAYLFRSQMPGYLYIASGANGKLMKLGFSNDPANRLAIANYEGWGGYDDWCLEAYGWAKEAGRLESELHAKFARTCVRLEWERNGQPTVTREAFAADFEAAIMELGLLCDSFLEIVT